MYVLNMLNINDMPTYAELKKYFKWKTLILMLMFSVFPHFFKSPEFGH